MAIQQPTYEKSIGWEKRKTQFSTKTYLPTVQGVVVGVKAPSCWNQTELTFIFGPMRLRTDKMTPVEVLFITNGPIILKYINSLLSLCVRPFFTHTVRIVFQSQKTSQRWKEPPWAEQNPGPIKSYLLLLSRLKLFRL